MSEAVVPIDRTNVAALIPAYFEEKRISEVTRRTLAHLDHVLVIDDGSTDATAAQAQMAGATVIRHPQNQGKGAAIKTGLRALSSRPGLRYILVLDADGQHLPEEIPAFLAEANHSTAPMIVGSRMHDLETMPFVRKMTNLFMSSQISRLCRQHIPDTQCGFRMFDHHLAAVLSETESSRYDYETEMLVIAARRGARIVSIPVSTVYGDEKSKIHPVRDTLRFFKLMRRLRRNSPHQHGSS